MGSLPGSGGNSPHMKAFLANKTQYAEADFIDLLINESPDATVFTTPDGTISYWSAGAAAIFGFGVPAALGQSLSELITPAGVFEGKDESEAAQKTFPNGSATFESICQRQDRTLIHVDVSRKEIRDPSGQLKFIISNYKDVSNLRAIRDARLIEAQYRDLLESTPDGMVIVNATGRIVLTTGQADRLFGYQHGELLGKPIEILVPVRSRQNHVAHRAKYSSHPHARAMGAGMELYGLRRDGSQFPVEISLGPLKTPEGTLTMSAIRDVTERKRAEEVLRQSEELFRLLVGGIQDYAIFMLSPEGRIASWNKGAERIKGYEEKEIIGQHFSRFYLAEDIALGKPERELDTARKDGRLEDEGWRVRKDGQRFWASVVITALFDPDGSLRGFSKITRDITEHKRIETALKDKNLELLNAASAKNQFLANMSHELRTPLNGIIGFAEFLADGKPGPLNPKQKEYLGDILSSGNHLLQLVNDVLDLAKVEAGKIELHPELFSLNKAVEEVCSITKPIVQKKNITLEVNIAPELASVTLDQQKFKQVLYNLLSNAVKFTGESGKVKIRAAPLGPHHFSLAVEDTGIGIKPEDLGRLFKVFEQLEHYETRRYQGTGLGLALTHKIVEAQGGEISVVSQAGKGSTFTIVLPLAMIKNGN